MVPGGWGMGKRDRETLPQQGVGSFLPCGGLAAFL